MKYILILSILFLALGLYSQPLNTEEDLKNDVIQVNYTKKSTAMAAVMSAVFPGAGQFYVNKKSVTAYLFPLIEIAMIAGYIHFNNEGNNITSNYEDFADDHYRRERQVRIQDHLYRYVDYADPDHAHDYEVYDPDGNFFMLDEKKTQHYYEDIGKYEKYVFGWDDWWSNYTDVDISALDYSDNYPGMDNSNGYLGVSDSDLGITWDFDGTNLVGAYPKDGATNYGTSESANRSKYNKMRGDAEEEYDKAHMFIFGLALNHIASAIDAAVVTKKYNRNYITYNQHKLDFKIAARQFNNSLTPTLNLTTRF